MSGNVWEWVWDIYDSYPSEAQTDPHGATSGFKRVLRGGGWNDYASDCTVSARGRLYATFTDCQIGFRVCRVSP